MLQGFQLLLLD
jgi:hypothetical protein